MPFFLLEFQFYHVARTKAEMLERLRAVISQQYAASVFTLFFSGAS